MTQFTSIEAADFKALGWEVYSDTASLTLAAHGLDFTVSAMGELHIQGAFEGKSWRWLYQSKEETARLAACVAADFFHARTGFGLFQQKGA